MVNATFLKSKHSNLDLVKASCRIILLFILLSLSFTVFSQTHKKIGQVNDFKKYLQLTAIGNNEKLIQSSDSNLSIIVNERKSQNDKSIITGVVKGSKGSNVNFKFSLSQLDGTIVIPERKKAYKYFSDVLGSAFVKEVDIDSLLCVDYPEVKDDSIQTTNPQGAPPPTSDVYHLQSLPGVPYVIMLDFDGQYVQNPNWNGGNPISALPADITEADLIKIWKGVSEDYTPFNLNITTDEAVFQAAPKGQRMRCIFTPTNDFYPGAGGVAYIGSFLWTDDTPCWSFYYAFKSGVEVGSHEVGHTLGLGHDGRELPSGHEEYYAGQGDWAPIMGVGYYVNLTQWSKGEYQYANNTEDDIAVMGGTANKFGFKIDDAGNTNATSKPLSIDASGALLTNKGLVTTRTDIDVYSFTTIGGSVTLTVSPNTVNPDLDVLLNLSNQAGNIIATANPTTSLSATITSTLAAGTYYLQIDGTGMGDPFTTGYSDYASIGEYTITGNIPVSPVNCTSSGTILREYWGNVPGFAISDIPFNSTPSGTSYLTSFDGPINFADSFGARYRGYVCAPITGNYTFWISSDDNSELWLSTNDNPANKVKIASVTGWNLVNEWEKYPSQKSTLINLVAGQRYYIEALHKDATSDDHLSVGWQLPNSTLERPIPGNRLSPYGTGNNSPTVSITNPTKGQIFTVPTTITIDANASDSDGSIIKVEFYQGTTKLGEDVSSPYSFSWTNVPQGNYNLTAKAFDNGGAQTTSSVINITVTGIVTCTATGTILREVWTNVVGTSVSTVPVNTNPTSTNQLTILEAPSNIGDNYGTRIRGYVCPPISGSYAFWIASNDNSELWLSLSDNPLGKVKIANVITFSNPEEWEKFPGQKSVALNLTAGNKYYIEVLHKEGVGTDHVAVGWQLPNGILERPIPGNRLSPYGVTNNPPTVSITSPANNVSFIAPASFTITATANDADGTVSKVEFYNGSTLLGTSTSSPYNYNWTGVAAGTYSLTTKAYDDLGATTTSSVITVNVIGNTAPVVSITSPANNASFTAPASITITANASDSDGTIMKVEFYQGTIKLGEDATSPYSFNWTNVSQGNYNLTANAIDNQGAQTTSTVVNINVTGIGTCTASGSILREYWANIPGFAISDIPFNTTPTSTSYISTFDGPVNFADAFGARYRGYVCPPVTGNYTFWISSDDNSELWLSTNDNPANKVKIASVTGWDFVDEWEKYPTQKSVLINLVAGQRYYIEALHKEATSDDHLSVGWQLPNSTLERPIPGNRLSPYGGGNNPPSVTITNPTNGFSFNAPANITINANASDSDGSITKVEFYQGSTKLGEDAISPYSFNWTNVIESEYYLTAVAYDNSGAQTTSAVVHIIVTGTTTCSATGTILREVWTGITGTAVSAIPVNTSPSTSNQLNILEAPVNIGDNYGTRIIGYVCPPASGNYIFWISSNDNSELWLSNSDNPNSKTRIAFVNGYTASREWEKYTTQKSAAINLTAGQKYYIEILHKEGTGSDHVSVGWQLPNAVLERPIPGNRLSPFAGGNNSPSVSVTSPTNGQSFAAPATIAINANASDSDGSIMKVEFYQGTTKLGEDATSPYSFDWASVPAGNYTLTAKAFDNGGASTTSSSVSITVTGTGCTTSGTILREVWNGVAGSTVSLIPTQLTPNSTSQVSIFEGPSNVGTNYGARYRGYICVPTTGNYVFWISSNDNSELWLSTSDNPVNKVKIAFVAGFTGIREWTKYTSQQSALINLVAGQRYYIEALHKQGSGTDNLAVGWQLPNSTLERPIPGNRLSPYTGSQTLAAPISFFKEVNSKETLYDSINVNLFPNPAEKGFVTLTIEGYEQTKQKAIIEIKDLSGNVIYKNKVSCDITCHRTIINIDEKFITGTYIVEVRVGENVFIKRLQIE